MNAALCNTLTGLLTALVLTGCQETVPKYRWGIYEDHLHKAYVQGSDTSARRSAQILQRDIDATLESGNIVPPGQYAHLGFLYYQANEISTAIDYLNKEKIDYPESATFIDTLLKNIQAQNQ